MKRMILCAAMAVAFMSSNAVAQSCSKCQGEKSVATSLTVANENDETEGDAKVTDIVTTAVQAGSFKTLAAALGAADLVDALQGDGPFTVFAPTDEAFAKLDQDLVADLLKPENKEKLQAILKYHVVSGKVMASDVLGASQVETLNGAQAPVGLTIGGANIITTDINCSNGVIHVIDTVILPPSN